MRGASVPESRASPALARHARSAAAQQRA
jgi:hypothetical protein